MKPPKKLYDSHGQIVPYTYRQKLELLSNRVTDLVTRKWERGYLFDAIEAIIRERLEHYGEFELSRSNFNKVIFATEDLEGVMLKLIIGAYPEYRSTVVETFCLKVSNLIYEKGFKEEIIELFYTMILSEMNYRFSKDRKFRVIGQKIPKDEAVIRAR